MADPPTTEAAPPAESPEAVYDRRLCAVIGQQWLSLLEKTREAHSHDTVMVSFVLNSTGQVSDLQVAEPPASKVAALICLRAVETTAPYSPWPPAMRKRYGARRALLFAFQFDAQENGYLAYWDQGELIGAVGDSTVYIPGEQALSASTNRPWRLQSLPVMVPREKPQQYWGPGTYPGFIPDFYPHSEPHNPPVWTPPIQLPPPYTGPGPKTR